MPGLMSSKGSNAKHQTVCVDGCADAVSETSTLRAQRLKNFKIALWGCDFQAGLTISSEPPINHCSLIYPYPSISDLVGGISDHGFSRTKTQTTPNTVFTRDKRKLRPWSEFLGRENSDHGLSLGYFGDRETRRLSIKAPFFCVEF